MPMGTQPTIADEASSFASTVLGRASPLYSAESNVLEKKVAQYRREVPERTG